MSADDVKPSRLAEAKRRAAELIEQMAPGDVAMIVRFSDSARIEQSFTDNHRELLRQLDEIGPTNRSTRIGEALRLAAGLANPTKAREISETQVVEGQPATLYILSDGKFPDVVGFSLGNLTPVYVPIGEAHAPNVGIVAFSTRRREDRKDQMQAFGRLENFGDEDLTADVELYRDETLVDASRVELKARESGGVAFDLGDLHSATLRLRVASGGDLKADDEAWAAIDPPLRSKVLLVTPGNNALEFALATESARELAEVDVAAPEVLETKDYQQKAAAGYYALVMYDRCQPKEMPQSDTLFIGALPPGTSWTESAPKPAPQIIDVETAHPLMQLIDLGNVNFAEAGALKPPAGSTVLISTDVGPLLAIGPRDNFEDAVLAGEIVGTNDKGERYANTDWPLRLSFPVFVLNVLTYFGDASASGGSTSIEPGRAIMLRSAGAADTLTVRTPDGRSVGLKRERGEAFNFSDTDALGLYTVEEPQQDLRHFAVNLFDSAESDIDPRPTIQIGYSAVKGEAGTQGARRELWKFLLVGALVVLALEWYIYNRRVYL